jgi:hypothetical protein
MGGIRERDGLSWVEKIGRYGDLQGTLLNWLSPQQACNNKIPINSIDRKLEHHEEDYSHQCKRPPLTRVNETIETSRRLRGPQGKLLLLK